MNNSNDSSNSSLLKNLIQTAKNDCYNEELAKQRVEDSPLTKSLREKRETNASSSAQR